MDSPLAAFLLLDVFRAHQFAHGNEGLRHPFVAYQISLEPTVRALERLLDALEQTLLEPGDVMKVAHDALAEPTERCLYALMEHLDACRSVIRAFQINFPQPMGRCAVEQFSRTIKGARDFTGRQINAIKHRQARVRVMGFTGSATVLGYFVEGPTASGTIGPSEFVHGSTHTAFSYARALRFWLASLVFCSRALLTQLREVAPDPVVGAEGLGSLAPLVRRIHDLPPFLFPDETGEQAPALICKADGIALTFPGTARWWRHPPPSARISVSYRGDGVSNTFFLPYMNEARRERVR